MKYKSNWLQKRSGCLNIQIRKTIDSDFAEERTEIERNEIMESNNTVYQMPKE